MILRTDGTMKRLVAERFLGDTAARPAPPVRLGVGRWPFQ